jgi:hypothetical protein
MIYFMYIAGFLFLYAVLFLAAGVLGRGWFLWSEGESEGKPHGSGIDSATSHDPVSALRR